MVKENHFGSYKTFKQFNCFSVSAVDSTTLVNLIYNVKRVSVLCHQKCECLTDTLDDEIYQAKK